jgi:hypothetical protein
LQDSAEMMQFAKEIIGEGFAYIREDKVDELPESYSQELVN